MNPATPDQGPFKGRSTGYSQTSLVDDTVRSVHTGLTLSELDCGGALPLHVHSFEESFYVLEGEALLTVDGEQLHLRPGDFGVIKVGTPHAWKTSFTHNSDKPVRWLETFSPQPPSENMFRFLAEWETKAKELEEG